MINWWLDYTTLRNWLQNFMLRIFLRWCRMSFWVCWLPPASSRSVRLPAVCEQLWRWCTVPTAQAKWPWNPARITVSMWCVGVWPTRLTWTRNGTTSSVRDHHVDADTFCSLYELFWSLMFPAITVMTQSVWFGNRLYLDNSVLLCSLTSCHFTARISPKTIKVLCNLD